MEEDSLSRLLRHRLACRSGVAHLLSTLESTRASTSSAQRKHIRFGALLRLLDEKIASLEDLDVKIQLAVNDDAMESEILSSTQYLNDLLKQRASFKAYYEGLKPLLDVADEAAPITSAGSLTIQPSATLQVPEPLSTLHSEKPTSSTFCASPTPTTPSGDATVAVIELCNVPTLDSSVLIDPSILNTATDSTLGCADGSSSIPFKPTVNPISSRSFLPEVILPSDEGYHHSSVPAAYVSKNFDLGVIEHDKDSLSLPICAAHVSRTIDLSVIEDRNHLTIPDLPTEGAADSLPLFIGLKPISRFISYDNSPIIPVLPTERATDSSPLLIGLKSISRFNDHTNHPTDSFYTAFVLQAEAHRVAFLFCTFGSPSFEYDPAALRHHPYRNPTVRPAQPPPWLRGV